MDVAGRNFIPSVGAIYKEAITFCIVAKFKEVTVIAGNTNFSRSTFAS
jgi:hypothetical protein